MDLSESQEGTRHVLPHRSRWGIWRAFTFAALGFIGKDALVYGTGWAVESVLSFNTWVARLSFSATLTVVTLAIIAPVAMGLWNKLFAHYLRMPKFTYSQTVIIATFSTS
ncbi:MAG: hypothetical protein U9Q79_04410 [Candidatus Hydrogenedentes bacterium]|nr:hypothetical protein [Candidatus Hydrogenedentota bacterium]